MNLQQTTIRNRKLMQIKSGSRLVPASKMAVVFLMLPLASIAGSETRLAQAQEANQEDSSQLPDKADASVSEVVVTAQRRSERLEEVPISISVLGGEALDRDTLRGVADALHSIPGVATTASYQGGGTLVGVRGVTAGGALFTGSSPVSYYLDSTPFGFVKTAFAPDASAYDLERVEVLRGPQGTLYGASAQNGVVRILTHDADLDRVEFKARTSYSQTGLSDDDNVHADAAINVPIVQGKLAARAVIGYQDNAGWIDRPLKKDANDSKLRNYRLKVNAKPTEALAVALSGWSSRFDLSAQSTSRDGQSATSLLEEPVRSDYDVYGLKMTYDFPAFTATSSTGYIDFYNNNFLDYAPFFPVTAANPIPTILETTLQTKIFSQELTLNSSGNGPWRWSIGGMYRDAKDRLYQFRRQLVAPTDYADLSKSVAVFGEVTRLLSGGRFEVTAGLRHFEDDVTQRENVVGTGNPADALYRANQTFKKDSPRVVLTWHPVDRTSIYTSYAEGFRSGFNQNASVFRAAPGFPALRADNLKNYEMGAKGNFLEHALSFDAAVFFTDWQDIQQSLGVPYSGAFVTALVNGKSASGLGYEFALSGEPLDGLRLSVNYSFNDLTLDEDVLVSTAQISNLRLIAKGDRANLSPERTVGAQAEYMIGFGQSGYAGRFAVSTSYMSKMVLHAIVGTNAIAATGDSLLISRASFSVTAPGNWTATAFVDNAGNENGIAAPSATFVDWASRVQPRTVGVQLEYRLGR